MFRTLLVATLIISPLPALAQQTTADVPAARCFLAGKAFSPGATIKASAGVDACGADGMWAATDKTAAGCFLADNFYSVGGIAAVTGDKSQIELCGADGSWTLAAAKPAP
jgi:hypothetical protein